MLDEKSKCRQDASVIAPHQQESTSRCRETPTSTRDTAPALKLQFNWEEWWIMRTWLSGWMREGVWCLRCQTNKRFYCTTQPHPQPRPPPPPTRAGVLIGRRWKSDSLTPSVLLPWLCQSGCVWQSPTWQHCLTFPQRGGVTKRFWQNKEQRRRQHPDSYEF